MKHEVRIQPYGKTIEVGESGPTMLEVALEAGLPYPHMCRAGICGECKSRLVSGEVSLQPYLDSAMTEEEKAAGLILACRANPLRPCRIIHITDEAAGGDPPEPPVHFPRKRIECRIVGLENATHDIRIVRLRPADGEVYEFAAGQYASLIFFGPEGPLEPRDYSMANQPGDPVFEFQIRRVPGGVVSAYVYDNLAVGDSVVVDGPMGTSYLRDLHAGPILAIAGGSGLAPIKSIVGTALARNPAREVHLYFGVREERDLYLEDHFRALAGRHPRMTFAPVLSEPGGPGERRTGLVTDAVARDIEDLSGWKAYLAGPPPMVEAARALLEERGLGAHDIHADAFYTAADRAAVATAG